jgi:hypothetical protein
MWVCCQIAYTKHQEMLVHMGFPCIFFLEQCLYIYIRIYIYIPRYYLDPNMYFAFVGRNPQCGLPRFLIFGWPFWCLSLYVSNTETKANHSMYMYISSYKMSCCIYMYIYISYAIVVSGVVSRNE